MEKASVKELTKLGMTQYEAMAYTALVGLGEGTARQVHEESGVPRPRIYDILSSLEERGFVEVCQGRPKCFRAVPVDRLLRIMREDLERSIGVVSSELSELSIQAKKRSFPIWHVKGEMSIKEQMTEILKDAKKEVLVATPRASALRSIIGELKKVNGKAEVLCLSPEPMNAFREAMPMASFVQPGIENDSLAEVYRTSFLGKAPADGSQARIDLLVIVDGVRSMLVYNEKDERIGIVFELPIITMLQRGAIRIIAEGSKGPS